MVVFKPCTHIVLAPVLLRLSINKKDKYSCMDVLAYSCIAIVWSLARDRELGAAEVTLQRRSCYSSYKIWDITGILLAFLVVFFTCILHHSGLFGQKGCENSGIRQWKPYSEPQLCPIWPCIPYQRPHSQDKDRLLSGTSQLYASRYKLFKFEFLLFLSN